MPRGQWNDNKGRSKAAKKGAAHRKGKPRGPYGSRVLAPEVSERMRAIAARVCAAKGPLRGPEGGLPSPGEVAERIDAVLGAMDARDREKMA